MSKTFRGDSTHLNKQLSSKIAWSEMKLKGAGAFRNLLHTSIKASFIIDRRTIERRTTLIAYKYAMGKNTNAYAKFCSD